MALFGQGFLRQCLQYRKDSRQKPWKSIFRWKKRKSIHNCQWKWEFYTKYCTSYGTSSLENWLKRWLWPILFLKEDMSLCIKTCLTNRSNLNFRCIGFISASYFSLSKNIDKERFYGTVDCKLNCSSVFLSLINHFV